MDTRLIPIQAQLLEEIHQPEDSYRRVVYCENIYHPMSPTRIEPSRYINTLMCASVMKPLVFGDVYLSICTHGPVLDKDFVQKEAIVKRYMNCRESVVMSNSVDGNTVTYYITTNMRRLARGYYKTEREAQINCFDKDWFGDLKYWCDPTAFHDRKYTMHIRCTLNSCCDIAMSGMTIIKHVSDQCIDPIWLKNVSEDWYNDTCDGLKKYHSDLPIQPSAHPLNPSGAMCDMIVSGNTEDWHQLIWENSKFSGELCDLMSMIKNELSHKL